MMIDLHSLKISEFVQKIWAQFWGKSFKDHVELLKGGLYLANIGIIGIHVEGIKDFNEFDSSLHE